MFRLDKVRGSYWNHSRFNDWLYGLEGFYRPTAATSEQWREWDKSVEHTFAKYADDAVSVLQDIVMFIPDVFNTLSSWYDVRFIQKSHILPTNLEPGKFHEREQQVLHALFTVLTVFVERDCARSHLYGMVKSERKAAGYPNTRWGVLRFVSAEAGLAYLNELISTPHEYADEETIATYQKIKDLYIWWNKTRIERPDANLCVPKVPLSDSLRLLLDTTSEYSKAYSKAREIKIKYRDEDTQKMHELIDVLRDLYA